MLWWAEGTKARRDLRWKNTWMYHVDFTNTDPEMVRLFVEFLRKDIGIDERRLKLQLQIHLGDVQEELELFWSNITDIPRERFYKTIVRARGNKVGKTKGTCKVRYCDKKTYIKLRAKLSEVLGPLGYTADR
ncbi:MAG: hypothetical protein RLZZ324_33 [Candidatus Parcubacteria bacterium]|jgi:hypothetical protein